MRLRGRGLVMAFLLAAAAGSAAAQAAHPDSGERTAADAEFRRLFSEQRFAEALPLARRVVELTEAADPDDDELPTAYGNLGVVQLRAGDPLAAQASFQHALELLEGRVGIASRRMVAPLAGLGAAYAAQGHHALAAEALQRALAISRRANGLFNIGQLDLLETLVENYDAAGNKAGIERERRYAVQVVRNEYGPDDPRTVPELVKLAEWFERTDNYAAARAQWQAVVSIASGESGGRNTATIVGLIGIARNYRLQFVRDPESLITTEVPVDPWTGRPDPFLVPPGGQGPAKLAREGENAALQALAILDETPDPPRKILALALTELGDWYITAGKVATAIPYYRRAWPVFAETVGAGQPNPLAVPRPLRYLPPAAAIRNKDRTDVEVVKKPFEFAMSISATGDPDNVRSVTVDADEYRAAQIRRALAHAAFSPRFENGEPVATDDYRFTEFWYDAVTAAQPAPAAEPKPSQSGGGAS